MEIELKNDISPKKFLLKSSLEKAAYEFFLKPLIINLLFCFAKSFFGIAPFHMTSEFFLLSCDLISFESQEIQSVSFSFS